MNYEVTGRLQIWTLGLDYKYSSKISTGPVIICRCYLELELELLQHSICIQLFAQSNAGIPLRTNSNIILTKTFLQFSSENFVQGFQLNVNFRLVSPCFVPFMSGNLKEWESNIIMIILKGSVTVRVSMGVINCNTCLRRVYAWWALDVEMKLPAVNTFIHLYFHLLLFTFIK